MVNPLKAAAGMVTNLLPVGPGTVLPLTPKIPDIGSFIANLGAALEGLLGVSRASEENAVAEEPVRREDEQRDEGLEFAPVNDLRVRVPVTPESAERASSSDTVATERPEVPAAKAQGGLQEESPSRPLGTGTSTAETATPDGDEPGSSKETPSSATPAASTGLSIDMESSSIPATFMATGRDASPAAGKNAEAGTVPPPVLPAVASAPSSAAATVAAIPVQGAAAAAFTVPAGVVGAVSPSALPVPTGEAAALGERLGPAAPAAGGDASGLSGFRSFGASRAAVAPAVAQEDRAQFIERIVQAARLTQTRGTARIRLALDPPRLGRVRVDLSLEQHTLQATFRTDTAAAKEVILANADALRSALESQGIHVGEFQVQVDNAFGQASHDASHAGTPSSSQAQPGPEAAGSVAAAEAPESPRVLSTRAQLVDVVA